MLGKNVHHGRVLPAVLGVLSLLLLGVAAFFAYHYHRTASSLKQISQMAVSEQVKADQAGGVSTGQIIKRLPESSQPIFENIGEFVVNLGQDRPSGRDYVLQTNVQVQLYSEKDRALVSSYQPKIKDHILRLLASKRYEDLRTGSDKERLSGEIALAIDQAVGKRDTVYDVLFTSFIIQED